MSVTLADVRDLPSGVSYPNLARLGSETALILFAAQWLGKQDAVWIADAGLQGTCVDVQPDKLRQMEAIYPDGWEFVCADVFPFTERTDRSWDVVSIDCPSNMFQECADLIERWCSLARDAVILGTGVGTMVTAPDGWAVSEVRKRSDYDGGVYWTVLEPV